MVLGIIKRSLLDTQSTQPPIPELGLGPVGKPLDRSAHLVTTMEGVSIPQHDGPVNNRLGPSSLCEIHLPQVPIDKDQW